MKTIWLKVTSAIVVGGDIAKPGELVEVTQGEAKNLLHRGKAELATAEDLPEAEDQELLQDDEPVSDIEVPAVVSEPIDAKAKKPAKKGK